MKSNTAASKDDKVLHLVRHGVTEMNVFLGSAPQGFTDPLMYDTRLTPEGREQAKSVNKKVAELGPIDLIVTSPLTRAMDTMQLAFAGVDAPKVVCELARERLWMASDIGRHPNDLLLEYPALDFSSLADIWWHTDGKGDPLAIFPESPEIFRARVAAFKEWLAARPERTIAVVSHWGVLFSLTGKEFENCELHTCRLSDLKHIYLT
ncbi:phosphoglycerate mutase [Klebsormidium nitens]|uniref:Phosphoglycerate mutase n=1 Tax=Klebsormidium nitens TaxID=105231 RepID=A0A1Y1I690_KLENI|nr:phosphoglycerate mutase [Klebsormidium nitens]|eukprot:GAQ86475.1 phosphoglycerate mutase [Klebsormidium nitens]